MQPQHLGVGVGGLLSVLEASSRPNDRACLKNQCGQCPEGHQGLLSGLYASIHGTPMNKHAKNLKNALEKVGTEVRSIQSRLGSRQARWS